MKNMFRKFLVSSILCAGAGGALAANTVVGSITIPKAVNGTDGNPGKSALQIWCDSKGYAYNSSDCTNAKFLAALKGEPGNDGADGKDGTSIQIKGTVATCNDLPTSGNTIGDIYLVTGQNNLGYMWAGTANNAGGWNCPSKGINIKGDSGADGCDIQLQTATSDQDGCTLLKWIKQFKTDGSCEAKNDNTAWGSLLVCNGNDGDNGTGVCDGDGDKSKMIKNIVSARSNPTWNSTKGIFTNRGYYTKTQYYCNNESKQTPAEMDKCTQVGIGGVLSSASIAEKCPNGFYYTCDWPTGEATITGVTNGKYNVCESVSDVKPVCSEPAKKYEQNVGNDCGQWYKRKQVWDTTQNKCVEDSNEQWISEGDPICPPCDDYKVTSAKTAGCYTISIYKQTRNSGHVCTPGQNADSTLELCDGDEGPVGPAGDVCDGVESSKLYSTVKSTSERSYQEPYKADSNSLYYTYEGGYTSVKTYCSNNIGKGWEPDECKSLTQNEVVSHSPAFSQRCGGTVKECYRSNKNESANDRVYYVCSESCAKSTTEYNQPTLASGSTDSNCVNSGKCATAPGYTLTTETNGCGGTGTNAWKTSAIKKPDDCVEPVVKSCSTSVSSSGVCTYYTCSVGDNNAKATNIAANATTYTLRKPLTDDNNPFKMADDSKKVTCKTTTVEYIVPTGGTGTSTAKYYTGVGKTKTTVTNNCGSTTQTEIYYKEDSCVTNGDKTFVSTNTEYTYKTCTVGKDGTTVDSNTTYTLRKTAESETTQLKNKVDDSALSGKIDNWATTQTSLVKENALSGKIDNWATTQTSLVKENALSGKIGNWANSQTILAKQSEFSDLSGEVGGIKATVGDSTGGLVKDVADASTAAATATSTANAAQSAVAGKLDTSDFNTALYGSGGSAASPTATSIAGKANAALPTSSFSQQSVANLGFPTNADLYGSGGNAANPATNSIAFNANHALHRATKNGNTVIIDDDGALFNVTENSTKITNLESTVGDTSRGLVKILNDTIDQLADYLAEACSESGNANSAACTHSTAVSNIR